MTKRGDRVAYAMKHVAGAAVGGFVVVVAVGLFVAISGGCVDSRSLGRACYDDAGRIEDCTKNEYCKEDAGFVHCDFPDASEGE